MYVLKDQVRTRSKNVILAFFHERGAFYKSGQPQARPESFLYKKIDFYMVSPKTCPESPRFAFAAFGLYLAERH